MNIIKSVKSNGMLESFMFEPKHQMLQEFATFINVVCKDSEYVNLSEKSQSMDVLVELHNSYFLVKIGKPTLQMRVRMDNDGLGLYYVTGSMCDDSFIQLMGMSVDAEEGIDEFSEFKEGIKAELCSAFQAVGLTTKNFRIRMIKKGDEIRKVLFRPTSPLVSEYLSQVGISLDLSNFIDLENLPKKGNILEAEQKKDRLRLTKEGKSEEEIVKYLNDKKVVNPQYDIMLDLYYGTSNEKVVHLGMYTVPNNGVKFSNGTDENLYQDDFIKVIGIEQNQLQDFKKALNAEVLEVLKQLNIKKLDNSIHALGLEEPWANDTSNAMKNIKDIRSLRKTKGHSKAISV